MVEENDLGSLKIEVLGSQLNDRKPMTLPELLKLFHILTNTDLRHCHIRNSSPRFGKSYTFRVSLRTRLFPLLL